MSSYDELATRYDDLTVDVDYNKWCDFYELIFKTENIAPKSVLDLACGTGTLSYILTARGYDVIGADMSSEMLSIAAAKLDELSEDAPRPLFICQDMRKLDLYGTVDSVVCCLDGINYLTNPRDAERTFERARLFLNPGGIFIFDINSAFKLRSLDGGMFIDETEGTYCVWRTEFDEAAKICHYGFDIFEKTDSGLWRRESEEHSQYAYELSELEDMLLAAGFEDVRFYADKKLEPPGADELRIFVAARRHT